MKNGSYESVVIFCARDNEENTRTYYPIHITETQMQVHASAAFQRNMRPCLESNFHTVMLDKNPQLQLGQTWQSDSRAILLNHYQGLIKHLDVRAFPEPTIDLDEVDLGNPYYLFRNNVTELLRCEQEGMGSLYPSIDPSISSIYRGQDQLLSDLLGRDRREGCITASHVNRAIIRKEQASL